MEQGTTVILAVVITIMAPHVFTITRLGWYDTPALTNSQLFAITRDGREVLVPSNFFGTISVTAAQGRLGRPNDGQFPTGTLGTTQHVSEFREAMDDCLFPVDAQQHYFRQPAELTHVVQLLHSYMIERTEADGTYRYDLYPHHIWSNPLLFSEFASLAPGDIDHYVYRTTSKCVRLGDSGPVTDLRASSEFSIPTKLGTPPVLNESRPK